MKSTLNNKKEKGHMGKTIIFDSSNDQELFMKDFLSPSDMQEKFDSWLSK